MSDNMYTDFNEEDFEKEAREKRKKRRVKSRIVSFAVFFLFLAVIVFGVWYLCNNVDVSRLLSKSPVSESVSSEISASEVSTETSEDIEEIIEKLLEDETSTSKEEETKVDPEEEFENKLDLMIDGMTTEEKVAGLFIVSPEAITGVDLAVLAGDGTREALEKYCVGGIVYRGDNILDENQFAEMTKNTMDFSKYKLFTCLYEGLGKDAVLGNNLSVDSTLNASEIAENMNPYDAYMDELTIGTYLSMYGINLNLGLTGVVSDEMNSGEQTDTTALFGNDSTIAGQILNQAITGLKESGVDAALGVFPSTGTLSENGGLKECTLTKEDFNNKAFNVFNAGLEAGAGALVISHCYVPTFTTDEMPASLSKEFVTDYIRTELGLTDTILISDALNKPEISDYYTSSEACVKALKAGEDMLLYPENFEEGYNGVLEAVDSGVISIERINQSLKRIYKVKYFDELYPKDEVKGEDGE